MHLTDLPIRLLARAIGLAPRGWTMVEVMPPVAEMVPIQKATRRFGQPHRSTPLRWVLNGVRTAGGEVVKLRAWRFGGRWMTTLEAVEEFARATTVPSDPSMPPRTPSARMQASEQAVSELERMGMRPGSWTRAAVFRGIQYRPGTPLGQGTLRGGPVREITMILASSRGQAKESLRDPVDEPVALISTPYARLSSTAWPILGKPYWTAAAFRERTDHIAAHLLGLGTDGRVGWVYQRMLRTGSTA
jgi:hypothetical protein